jgi:uncharacterized protein YeaO (DUF488 family)
MKTVAIKRIYDEPSDNDGYRILVDRLWPRGISIITAYLDEWNKEVAPSTELGNGLTINQNILMNSLNYIVKN